MRKAVLLAIPILVTAPRLATAAAATAQLSEEEREFCEDEVRLVENRQKIFQAQGLSAAEIARRNADPLRELSECRGRFRKNQAKAAEARQDMAEARRRAGPDATEVEREKVWREIRRERLGSKSPASLTAEEKAELAAGMAEEMAATHAALDSAHSRDPAFMRMVHSALSCLHGSRKEELDRLIASEEALVKVGSGDKLRLYTLRSQVRESEEVLARSNEAARSYASGLQSCTDHRVAIVTHCFGSAMAGKRSEPGCESEEMQQYIRFVR